MTMAVTVVSSTGLDSKYRGCMIGALLGDCLGFPFEFDSLVSTHALNRLLAGVILEGSTRTLIYSDDSSMTLSVASSLVEKREINAKDMAQRFVCEFYRDRYRSYGLQVQAVFKALQDTNYEDVFLPAKKQFRGKGSYGNGAAMRIAPIALFGNSRGEQFLINAAEECSRITHTHPNGYNGAILQCLAVNTALDLDPSQDFDPVKFITSLQEKMENLESEDSQKPLCEKLKKIIDILQTQDNISPQEIAKCLGNHEIAVESVPTAIYSFLRGMKPLEGYRYESSNPFMRTLYFAISVGGDTDTIATMAGAIAGAYYGADIIPKNLQKRCEAINRAIKLADKLFEATQKKE